MTAHGSRYAQEPVGRWVGVYNKYLTITKNVIGDIRLMPALPSFATVQGNEAVGSTSWRLRDNAGANVNAGAVVSAGEYLLVGKSADNSGKGSPAYEIIQVTGTSGPSQRNMTVARARVGTTAVAFAQGDPIARWVGDQITHLALGSADEDTRPISKLTVHLSA